MKDSYRKGRDGERRAGLFLEEQGYRILLQNFRTRLGEIDLIATLEPDVLVFVEVKNWAQFPLADLSYNLDQVRQERMLGVAEVFLQKHPEYQSYHVRFDLIIFQGRAGRPIHVSAAIS